MNMKKIILTAVMAWTLLCVGPIDFSYAEDLAKDLSELTGAEISEKNEPMILAQEKSTTSNYQFSEPYDTKKVEKEEDEEEEVEDEEYEDDDPDAGVRQKKRNEKRATEVKKH
jgi:hypothetical protein